MPNATPQYQGYIDRVGPLTLTTGRAVLYFTSIAGRDNSVCQYEWSKGPLNIESAKKKIESVLEERDLAHEVPFVISFPHLTRVLAWQSPELGSFETNLQELGMYNTLDMYSRPKTPGNKRTVVGCPLELAIFDQEISLWARANTVEEYLDETRNSALVVEVLEPNKILKRARG